MSQIVLSSSGGTGASLQFFLDCPYKFKLRYIDGLRPKIISQNLWFGSAVHNACLEKYLKQRCSNEEIIEYLRCEILYRSYAATPGGVELEIKDSPEELLDKAIKMFALFKELPITPVMVEEKFSTPLIDPSTGNCDTGVTVCGRVDLIHASRVQATFSDNLLTLVQTDDDTIPTVEVVADLKTSSAKINSINGHLFQLIFYAYLILQKTGRVPDYVSVINITKTKTPTVQTLFHRPTMAEVQSLYEMIRSAVEKIRKGEFAQNFLACRGRYHNDCEYLPLCHAECFEIPEIEIDKFLISDKN